MLARQHAEQIFRSAIAAVQPASLLPEHLSVSKDSLFIGGQSFAKNSFHHVYVIGAGKASAAMAIETEKILGTSITDGLVTTKYNHALATTKIKIMEGAHPVPDENCVQAVAQTIQLLRKATSDDLVICLLSGGASALWCDVPPGLSLQELQTTFDQLLKSGAAIHEINAVRKHLSSIKGGQLIRHGGGARFFSFLLSDVPTDDLDVIASGPTVADASTFQDAYAILLKYKLLPLLPESILLHIEKGLKGILQETPKANDSLFDHTVNKIIGNNRMAVQAAAKMAKSLGYHTHIIAPLITGDAAAEAKKLATLISTYQGEKPVCILQGGETTVQVTGQGKGGRNQHFALATLHELNKLQHGQVLHSITILSGGTDGTDGPTDAAGAVVDMETLHQASMKNLSVEDYLKNHDVYHFLEQTGSLLTTGPTQTNVMDVMMVLIK